MKKLGILVIVLSLLLVSGSAFAQNDMARMFRSGEFFVGANYDMGGSMKDEDTSYDTDAGFSITGEYVMPFRDEMSFGAGVTYQLPRGVDDPTFANTAEFNFIPLYGLVKYDLEEGAHVVGHLGYNLFNGNDDFVGAGELSGGLYYGAGIGINLAQLNNSDQVNLGLLNQMNLGLMYSVNSGTYTEGTDETDLSYSKLSITFNYRF
ncbi:MAG: hypothetical protein ACQEQH_08170 [Bacillota bacterium]